MGFPLPSHATPGSAWRQPCRVKKRKIWQVMARFEDLQKIDQTEADSIQTNSIAGDVMSLVWQALSLRAMGLSGQ